VVIETNAMAQKIRLIELVIVASMGRGLSLEEQQRG
jgi:hypothetical protein